MRQRPSLRCVSHSAGNRFPSEPRADMMPLGTFPLANWPVGLVVRFNFKLDFFFNDDDDWLAVAGWPSRFFSVSHSNSCCQFGGQQLGVPTVCQVDRLSQPTCIESVLQGCFLKLGLGCNGDELNGIFGGLRMVLLGKFVKLVCSFA